MNGVDKDTDFTICSMFTFRRNDAENLQEIRRRIFQDCSNNSSNKLYSPLLCFHRVVYTFVILIKLN